jgi:hypothetical protein
VDIIGTGIKYPGGELLFKPRDEESFGEDLRGALPRNAEMVAMTTRGVTFGAAFRGEVERRVEDPGDPRAAGWTYLINGKTARADEIKAALRPLAEWRSMEDPDAPLVFNDEPPEEWHEWLQENYHALELEGKKTPHYVMIAGGPEEVPFHFQSLLDSAACVGRVDFDSAEELENYVAKVIRLEKAAKPVVSREAVVFGTDGGLGDPTFFSRRFMAEPMAEHIQDKLGLGTRRLFGDGATKPELLNVLKEAKPALVYTASHGIITPYDFDLEDQKRINGSLVCQAVGREPLDDRLLGGDDVPLDKPFLEGSVFFQFACFGYGTPAESDFNHWLGEIPSTAKADFVARFPKKLLGHPQGPVAFVGHMDAAWLHGFEDPDAPFLVERWHDRIAPFVYAVNQLLRVQPVGLAMARMNKRYDFANHVIANTIDRDRRGKITWTPEYVQRFVDNFIFRSDAQNYLVLGDPAARLRIPDK